MSDSEISSFTSRYSCECYKKLQAYGIPLNIRDENDFLSEYETVLLYENAFELPGSLKINEDITEFPVIEENDLSDVFRQMAIVIPDLSDFEENVLSFYILDMVIEGLWTAQNEKMNFNHQKVTLLWILYFFNYIQKQNPSRNNLFSHLKAALFCCNKTIEESDERGIEFDKTSFKSDPSKTMYSNRVNQNTKIWDFPFPPNYNINSEVKSSSGISSEEGISTTTDQEGEIKSTFSTSKLKNQIHQTETNVSHTKTILEILYRIFARFWVYLEIQTALNSMPLVEQVDLPFTLNIPKPVLKVEPPTLIKGDKNGKKQSFLDKSSEGLESLQLNKNEFILPLQIAEEAKLYMRQLFAPQTSQRSVLGRNKEERNKK